MKPRCDTSKLTHDAAKAKDSGLAPLQHRHFATIATIVRTMQRPNEREYAANHFADALAATNPKFDRARFLRACE